MEEEGGSAGGGERRGKKGKWSALLLRMGVDDVDGIVSW